MGEKTPLRAGEEDELDWFWHRRHKSFFAPMWFLPLNFEWEGLRYFPPLILVKTSAHKTQIQIFVHMQIFALHTKNTKRIAFSKDLNLSKFNMSKSLTSLQAFKNKTFLWIIFAQCECMKSNCWIWVNVKFTYFTVWRNHHSFSSRPPSNYGQEYRPLFSSSKEKGECEMKKEYGRQAYFFVGAMSRMNCKVQAIILL